MSPLVYAAACGGSSDDAGSASSMGQGGSGVSSVASATSGSASSASSMSATGASGADASGAGASSASATGSTSTGCVAMCAGKACGPDGCGGECGMCPQAEACTSKGACVGAPAGPAVKRFDVATLDCGAAYPSCQVSGEDYDHCCPSMIPNDPKNKCFCAPEFDHADYAGVSHFLVVASDVHRGDIWAAGNFQAVYVNDLNDLYPGSGGKAKADAVIMDAKAGFPSGVPAWFLVNEISFSLWPNDAAYRQYVLDFANRMNGFYNKKIIVASPFPTVAAHDMDWATLAGDAFVAPEVQLTGAEVNQGGNSVSACQAVFQATADSYGLHGVGLPRLMLVDSYGGTKAGAGFGREGVSAAGWANAIQARAAGAHAVGFAGYVSYAWGNNAMGDDDATRAGFEDTYAATTVP